MKKRIKVLCATLVALTLSVVGAIALTPKTSTQDAAAAITYKSGANSISSSYQSSKYYSNLQ